MKGNYESISSLIAETITSPHNQDFRMMTVGRTGCGKSIANLDIAWKAAKKVAKIKGGKPDDYFNMENVAIIRPENVLQLFRNTEIYNIYLLDDVGLAWNARDFMKKLNRLLNDIFQIFRTENTAILLTIPHNMLIDKVPRSLAHYLMEPYTSNFQNNQTQWKLFEIDPKYRQGKLYYPFPKQEGEFHQKYVRYICSLPPPEILNAYEPIRKKIAEDIKQEKIDDYLAEEPNGGKGKKGGFDLVEAVDNLRKLQDISIAGACIALGSNTTEYYRKRKEKAIE